MKNSISNFQEIVNLLHDVLEVACKSSSKRKNIFSNHVVQHKLSYRHVQGFALCDIKDSVQMTFKLSFHQGDHIICVFTDAPESP